MAVDPRRIDAIAKQPNIGNLASGFRSSNKLNDNFDRIKDAFDNTLSRDGSGPNAMLAPLDMNNKRIINLPAASGVGDPVRLGDVTIDVEAIASAVLPTKLDVTGDNVQSTKDFKQAINSQDFVKLEDYGPLAISAAGNQAALDLAIADATNFISLSYGKTILLPSVPGGLILNNLTVEATEGSTTPITIQGSVQGTVIRPAEAVVNFINVNATLVTLRDFQVVDISNLISGSIIKGTGAATGLPVIIERITFVQGSNGPAHAVTNDGLENLTFRDSYVQNCQSAYNNIKGGVNNVVSSIYALGVKHGVILDNPTSGPSAEGFACYDSIFNCTQANARGLWIKQGLLLSFSDVHCVQLGTGGIGLRLEATAGSIQNCVFRDCYFEGSDTNPAIKSTGAVSYITFQGGGIGQGGYTPGLINCIDLDSVNDFDFSNFDILFPSGNCNKVMNVVGSTGIISVTCSGWEKANNVSTESSSVVRWELPGNACPTVRSPLSQYPYAAWTAYTPTVTSGTGTIGALGAVTGRYRVDGKTINLFVSVNIVTNGTANQDIRASVPVSARIGTPHPIFGREDGYSGAGVQGRVVDGILVMTAMNGSFVGGDTAHLIMNGTYEAA